MDYEKHKTSVSNLSQWADAAVTFVSTFRVCAIRLSLFFLLLPVTTVHASKRPELTLAQMLDQSDSVFIGTVTDIDESALEKQPGFDATKINPTTTSALTRVSFSVNEVLFGVSGASQIDLVLRGGLFPDGSFEEWSSVPVFSVGDEYVVFLAKGSYTVHPIVTAHAAIMRFASVAGQNVLVGENGNGINVDLTGSIVETAPVAESMLRRRDAQRINSQSSPVDGAPLAGAAAPSAGASGITPAGGTTLLVGSPGVVDANARAQTAPLTSAQVLANLRTAIRAYAKNQRKGATLTSRQPGPLDGKLGR